MQCILSTRTGWCKRTGCACVQQAMSSGTPAAPSPPPTTHHEPPAPPARPRNRLTASISSGSCSRERSRVRVTSGSADARRPTDSPWTARQPTMVSHRHPTTVAHSSALAAVDPEASITTVARSAQAAPVTARTRQSYEAQTSQHHPASVTQPASRQTATLPPRPPSPRSDVAAAAINDATETPEATGNAGTFAMPSSSSHRHPATVTQPASPTGSEPMLSLVEIALGFGPGWPPEQEITVLARRADLEQRRTHHQTHRALYRGNPKGSANTETAVALSAQQALTTTCECGALRDVSALNAGRQCGSQLRPTIPTH